MEPLMARLKRAEEIVVLNCSTESNMLFVIKKHRASSLHYDLRLRWNWVMLSWALPEGPSYCPDHKRTAVQVQDHERKNAGFEGVITEGRYGAGEVMLWDTGTWEPQPECIDVDAGLRDGCLKFTMHGERIKGDWTLVRTADADDNRPKPLWLLIKDPDQFARAAHEPSILEEFPNSVATGRSLEEIARYWATGKCKSTSQADLFQSIRADG
jgi:bifunctional non-homologous end joining protein LigD